MVVPFCWVVQTRAPADGLICAAGPKFPDHTNRGNDYWTLVIEVALFSAPSVLF
jgi:hypothetical protein